MFFRNASPMSLKPEPDEGRCRPSSAQALAGVHAFAGLTVPQKSASSVQQTENRVAWRRTYPNPAASPSARWAAGPAADRCPGTRGYPLPRPLKHTGYAGAPAGETPWRGTCRGPACSRGFCRQRHASRYPPRLLRVLARAIAARCYYPHNPQLSRNKAMRISRYGFDPGSIIVRLTGEAALKRSTVVSSPAITR